MPQLDPDASELLPALVSHAGMVQRMDDAHAEQYMFGDAQSSSWVAPWQPSELVVVDRACALAQVGEQDVVMDLGCGDGRVVLRMATLAGCRGLGWDASGECIQVAASLARASGLHASCTFRVVDFTQLPLCSEHEAELQSCTVIFVYLVHFGLGKIRGLLEALSDARPDLRVVTNTYHFPDDFWPVVARDERDVIRVWRRTSPQ
jgi:SAM-dependent methyltransferase